MEAEYKLITFDEFSPILGVLELPAKTLLLRGYDTTYPAIQHRPAYYTSSIEIARSYADRYENGRVGVFEITKPVRLYDIRFIIQLLRLLLNQSNSSKLDCTMTLCLAYGLCSFEKQMELFQMRYHKDLDTPHYDNLVQYGKSKKSFSSLDAIEKQGIRIGETTNDSEAVECLKNIFKNIDGYIAPMIFSPYHVEKTNYTLNSEIVLFNPEEVGVSLVTKSQGVKPIKMHVSSLLQKDMDASLYEFLMDTQRVKLWSSKAGGKKLPNSDQNTFHTEINHLFDTMTETEYRKLEKKAKRAVKGLTENVSMNGGGLRLFDWITRKQDDK
jgi:hypothetical protein